MEEKKIKNEKWEKFKKEITPSNYSPFFEEVEEFFGIKKWKKRN